MSSGAWAMVAALVLALGALGFTIASMVRSIQTERTAGGRVWREFSLSIALLVLFLATWGGQAIAEWQTYTDEQHQLGQSTQAGDFVAQFAQSTLENWQSEFLQLFAFVSLAALYVHKGSAESKDSDERVEASLRRIEEQLGSLPTGAPPPKDAFTLPDVPAPGS
jgi:hypothetical protein